ncbi:MAG: hypothetical protein HY235_19805 [Acidobacteria bacterium]|nr:hypothetical protein [Acidobacteriota bacterium]
MHRKPLLIGAMMLPIFSCSSGPTPPRPGTPAFYWQAAKENVGNSDYGKASDQLEKILNSQNDFTAKARPFRLVLLAGIAQAYIDIAETFEQGAQANKTNATPFHKYVGSFRSIASRYSIQFAEDFDKFTKAQTGSEVPLEFRVPAGTVAPVAMLDKVSTGFLPGPPDVEKAQNDALRRSVLLAVCSAAGASNDTAKATDVLKSESAKVSKDVFMQAMAQTLHAQAALFGKKKLGRPDHYKHFLTQALETLKGLPENKESKALRKKVEAGLKDLKGI